MMWVPAAQGQEEKEEGKKAEKGKGIDLIGLIAKQRRKADMTMTISHAKQIFYLLFEFDMDWGAFPSDETEKNDVDLKGYKGKYSNDYLGQFFAGGYVKNEGIFFAKGGAPTDKKPDNDISTKKKTLEAGECGFAYYKGLSTSHHSRLPLLLAPMTGKGFKFNPKPYNGKAVVLHIDGSVRQYDIDENGDVVLPNGKKFFEGGKETAWGKKGPDAKMLVFPR